MRNMMHTTGDDRRRGVSCYHVSIPSQRLAYGHLHNLVALASKQIRQHLKGRHPSQAFHQVDQKSVGEPRCHKLSMFVPHHRSARETEVGFHPIHS